MLLKKEIIRGNEDELSNQRFENMEIEVMGKSIYYDNEGVKSYEHALRDSIHGYSVEFDVSKGYWVKARRNGWNEEYEYRYYWLNGNRHGSSVSGYMFAGNEHGIQKHGVEEVYRKNYIHGYSYSYGREEVYDTKTGKIKYVKYDNGSDKYRVDDNGKLATFVTSLGNISLEMDMKTKQYTFKKDGEIIQPRSIREFTIIGHNTKYIEIKYGNYIRQFAIDNEDYYRQD